MGGAIGARGGGCALRGKTQNGPARQKGPGALTLARTRTSLKLSV